MPRLVALSCFVIALIASAHASPANSTIQGLWLTADGDGWIEFRILDGTLAGFIAGSPQDSDESPVVRLDVKNPNPELRDRPLTGLKIVYSLSELDDGKWQGRIYDPNSGKTYKCTLTLLDDSTLKLRGYLGFSLFGRTEVWTRKR